MNAIQIEVGDKEFAVLKQLAEKRNLSPEDCLERMVQESLKEVHDLAYWKERAKQADLKQFFEVMDKVPVVPPIPGDELPEGWNDQPNKH